MGAQFIIREAERARLNAEGWIDSLIKDRLKILRGQPEQNTAIELNIVTSSERAALSPGEAVFQNLRGPCQWERNGIPR
jgi:hypothetical protein